MRESSRRPVAAERAVVRPPWPDEFARIDRAFVLPTPALAIARSWVWVAAAGEVERLVGVAVLHETKRHGSGAGGPMAPTGLLDLDLREKWQRDTIARTLIDTALAEARTGGFGAVTTVTDPASALAGQLAARGFVEVGRRETWTMRVDAMRGFFAGRGGEMLARQPVKVSPLAAANLDHVRRICARQELLSPERVLPQGAALMEGFDPALSFFTGEAERPSGVLLARELNGMGYLEVLVRDPEVVEVRNSALALVGKLVEAVQALGLPEIMCSVRPGITPGLARLVRRHGGVCREAKAMLRMELT